MTRKEALSGAWVWANVVALLWELIFLAYGAPGLPQAAAILFLAWIFLKPAKPSLVLSTWIALSMLNGPLYVIVFANMHAWLANPLAHMPVFAIRSGIMLVALAPLAILQMRKAKPA